MPRGRRYFPQATGEQLPVLRLPSLNRNMVWRKSFLVFIFSLSVQKVVLACEAMKSKHEFPSPHLTSNTSTIRKGQNVSLVCSHQNKSLQITYVLFWKTTHLKTLNRTGEPMVANLIISEVKDLGPYKCKAIVSKCEKYSQALNFTFVSEDSAPAYPWLLLLGLLVVLMIIIIILILVFWIRPKYKARKALRERAPADCGPAPTGSGLYADIRPQHTDDPSVPDWGPGQDAPTAQDEPGLPLELHYASPVFREAASGEREAFNDCRKDCVYSEVTF